MSGAGSGGTAGTAFTADTAGSAGRAGPRAEMNVILAAARGRSAPPAPRSEHITAPWFAVRPCVT